jgi:hypothetical protein
VLLSSHIRAEAEALVLASGGGVRGAQRAGAGQGDHGPFGRSGFIVVRRVSQAARPAYPAVPASGRFSSNSTVTSSFSFSAPKNPV